MKNIRYYIFWGLDFLTGSKKKKHYKEIEQIYYQKGDYEAIKTRRINEILSYASQKTSFYKNFDSSNIKNFPIINKKTINANYDSFFSEDYINQKEKLRVMNTSGSTGERFRVYQNPEKVLRNKMDTLFFYDIGGYNVGDRVYSVRIWTHINKKKKLSLFLENFRMFNTANIDKEGMGAFRDILAKDHSKKVILSYASSLTELMNCITEQDKNIKWNIKSIFSGAEELPLPTKRKMIDFLRCPVISRYSNQEMGMFAQQPITGEDYFLTNEASYYFEFLKIDSDQEAKENEIARIVITDLFNKAVPLIRYDTGDLCTFGIKNNKKYIKTIQGRSLDIIKTNDGMLVSPYTVIVSLWDVKNIIQFQLTQEELDLLTLKVVHSFEKKEDSFAQIEEKMKKIFGDRTRLVIEEVSQIPLSTGGKRKYIISKI